MGVALGTWTARLPAVKQSLGVGDGSLGVALLGFAAGCLAGMQGAGRLVDRFGGARVMVPAAFGEVVLLLPTAYARSVPALAACLFMFGIVHGTLNIAMNA